MNVFKLLYDKPAQREHSIEQLTITSIENFSDFSVINLFEIML